MRASIIVIALLFVLSLAAAAVAGDIVTMPTANQVKAGEVDVADYYLFLDFPDYMPQFVRVQTLYVGVTNQIELDIHRYDLDKVNQPETMAIVSYKLLSENATQPDLVIGARDIAERTNNPAVPFKTSYYISAAKTVIAPKPGMAPKMPMVVRLHLSLGTKDPSLLNEDRHEGLFGGVQMLVTPKVGVVVQHDGQDLITALTYTHDPKWPTIKGGTFGKHSWIGLNYTFNVK